MKIMERFTLHHQLSEEEQKLVWKKPASHIESEAERRICQEIKRNWQSEEMKITNILLEGDAGSGKTQLAKALSAELGLPYTKVTCFADMDKADVLGSILPVAPDTEGATTDVNYRFYPSEIIRAYEQGWLLEIQEPTVIRDAAVLMALNSALELDGSINLPTRIVHRHPDFVVVITTNRGYNGCRPLNEALRDRIQHTEKMDLPPMEVMIERAIGKTGFSERPVLSLLAEVVQVLDREAKVSAIKGVAGMRSYLYWVDAVANGASLLSSLYHKVIYKITTNADEIILLEEALARNNLRERLEVLETEQAVKSVNNDSEVIEIKTFEAGEFIKSDEKKLRSDAARLRKTVDSEEGQSSRSSKELASQSKSTEGSQEGEAIYHELSEVESSELESKKFRKALNEEARKSVAKSSHQDVGLIVHRPKVTEDNRREYKEIIAGILPVIQALVQKTVPLLEYESGREKKMGKLYGTSFQASHLAAQDFRYFAKMSPPKKEPSLAVALRIDESASMSAYGRIEAAKATAVALYEFCTRSRIPVMIYGDSADKSRLEQMSLYSYVDFASRDVEEKYSLMNIKGRSNNRDGMALRIIGDRLLQARQETKLFISISDGQPKALPDYSGKTAIKDMRQTLQEYRQKGIIFLAAAIGQDKDIIGNIYGVENTLDITDISKLPTHLVQMISRYI